MRRQYLACPILIAVFFVIAVKCQGEVVYKNDFEVAVGSEWSNSSTSATPVGGRRFLGRFANDTVNLSLSELPAHTEATLYVDLFIIDTWDGNNTEYGPDRWSVKRDEITLLDTTFSQNIDSFDQSYPGSYLTSYPRRTGAAEIDTLGYMPYNDSVYSLSFSFPHVSESLVFSFSAFGLEDVSSESWGLDNVIVSTNLVPEPSSIMSLLCGGILLIYGRGRRRRW